MHAHNRTAVASNYRDVVDWIIVDRFASRDRLALGRVDRVVHYAARNISLRSCLGSIVLGKRSSLGCGTVFRCRFRNEAQRRRGHRSGNSSNRSRPIIGAAAADSVHDSLDGVNRVRDERRESFPERWRRWIYRARRIDQSIGNAIYHRMRNVRCAVWGYSAAWCKIVGPEVIFLMRSSGLRRVRRAQNRGARKKFPRCGF